MLQHGKINLRSRLIKGEGALHKDSTFRKYFLLIHLWFQHEIRDLLGGQRTFGRPKPVIAMDGLNYNARNSNVYIRL